jgi:hypothetical protein
LKTFDSFPDFILLNQSRCDNCHDFPLR